MSGNKQYFLQIVDQNKGIIRSLCKSYYRREEDQKDAFQDIVLQLWNSFEGFQGKSKISTWIYRVSLNTLLNKKRKDQNSISLESLDTQAIISTGADDHMELLYMVLHSLNDVDKALVVLYLEGYKYREIADLLSLSPTNVATRFNRLKTALKKKFNPQTHAVKPT